MVYILVLVASDKRLPVSASHLEWVASFLPVSGSCIWLASGQAVEMLLAEKPTIMQRQELDRFLALEKIDSFVISSAQPRRKKMLICDMDSTVVKGETLDDLASSLGLKAEISAITRRSMEGKLDFQEALRTRVSMLKGMPEEAVDAERARLQYTGGAWELVQTMSDTGAHCILVSGGFTCFTEVVAKELGFHYNHGNKLLFADGVATGSVGEPILHRGAKKEFLERYQQKFNVQSEDILAVGDGANDLDMLLEAGLGVGFHPKNFLRDRVENSILYGDLTSLLYLQGFSSQEFAKKS